MRKILLALLLLACFPLMLVCCNDTTKVEEIKVEASNEENTIDKHSEDLNTAPLEEPSEALAKKRREEVLKSFNTGQGCPNCQNKLSCEACNKKHSSCSCEKCDSCTSEKS